MCEHCGNVQASDWSPDLVPGQDIGVRLQAFVGWIRNYGHLSYEKQQELLWELGQIEIGVGTRSVECLFDIASLFDWSLD